MLCRNFFPRARHRLRSLSLLSFSFASRLRCSEARLRVSLFEASPCASSSQPPKHVKAKERDSKREREGKGGGAQRKKASMVRRWFFFFFFDLENTPPVSLSSPRPSHRPTFLSRPFFFFAHLFSLSKVERKNLAWPREREEKSASSFSPFFFSLSAALSLSPSHLLLSPTSKKKNSKTFLQFRFILLLSRQGKVRLSKWYVTAPPRERARLTRDLCAAVLGRPLRGGTCNVLEGCDASSSPLLGPLPSGPGGGAYPGSDGACSPAKVVYRRYASLYFVAGIDGGDNELIALETIHLLVEALDLYFGNVCELDLVFNFHRAHWLVDELVVGGRLVEPSRRASVRASEAQDRAVEEAKAGAGIIEATLGTDEV